MGVTYFKLDPQKKYELGGKDVTANRSLTGAEIDSNFNFLRGFDIANIEIADGNLVVNRLSGEDQIVVPLGGVSDIQLDENSGILKVISPSGEEKVIGRCVTDESGFFFATDETIDGKGTLKDPLRIARGELTGTYAPADTLLDLTTGDVRTLVDDPHEHVGYRVVTKEKAGTFGYLYNLAGVEEIKDKLVNASSPWRVPTKADWDELLDTVELLADPCGEVDEHLHDSDRLNVDLGALAGKCLKTSEMWDESSEATRGIGDFGFLVLPVGTVTSTYGDEVTDFGKTSAFWTDTVVHNTNEMYIKRFDYNKATVLQEGYGPNSKISLRLVKDATNRNEQDEYETIAGIDQSVQVVTIGEQVWTVANIGAELLEPSNSLRPVAWDADGVVEEGKEIYVLNEWDGTRWVKRRINEGYSIILRHYKDPELPEDFTGESYYHEYRVVKHDDGSESFSDIVGILQSEIQEEVDLIKDLVVRANNRVDEANEKVDQAIADVEAEEAQRIAEVSRLDDKIDNAVSDLTEDLNAAVSAINETIDSNVEDINSRITSVIQSFGETISDMDNRITEEVSALTNTISNEVDTINGRIDAEVNTLNDRVDTEVATINGRIDTEVDNLSDELSNAVTSLTDTMDTAIAAEIAFRTQADDDLQDQITANKVTSSGGTIIVTSGASGTNLAVNIDNDTLKTDSGGQIRTDLKLLSVPVDVAETATTRYAYVLGTGAGQSQTIKLPREVELVAVNSSDSSVAHSYELRYVGGDDRRLGARIDIPKDQMIKMVALADTNATITSEGIIIPGAPAGDAALCFSFFTNSGYELVKINLTTFIEENEFSSGLTVSNHVVSVQIAPNDEGFLRVSSAGVYTTGIQSAISTASANLTDLIGAEASAREAADAQLTNQITSETQNRTTADTQLSGLISSEATARETADNQLSNRITAETEARANSDAALADDITAETEAREAQVSALTARVAALESEVEALQSALSSLTRTIKNVIAQTLIGQDHQIEVKKLNSMGQETSTVSEVEQVKIKFASDAEFIADI